MFAHDVFPFDILCDLSLVPVSGAEINKNLLLSVTNNLQLQDVYSIRGLTHGTTYDLKVANIKYNSLSPHSGGEGPAERERKEGKLL